MNRFSLTLWACALFATLAHADPRCVDLTPPQEIALLDALETENARRRAPLTADEVFAQLTAQRLAEILADLDTRIRPRVPFLKRVRPAIRDEVIDAEVSEAVKARVRQKLAE